MDAVVELLRELPVIELSRVAWGEVTSVSPVEVRFAGDTADTPIALKQSGLTLATSDKVGLIRFGTQWVVALKLAAT